MYFADALSSKSIFYLALMFAIIKLAGYKPKKILATPIITIKLI